MVHLLDTLLDQEILAELCTVCWSTILKEGPVLPPHSPSSAACLESSQEGLESLSIQPCSDATPIGHELMENDSVSVKKMMSITFCVAISMQGFWGQSSPGESQTLLLLLSSGVHTWNQDSSSATTVSTGFNCHCIWCRLCWHIQTCLSFCALVRKCGTHFAGYFLLHKSFFRMQKLVVRVRPVS